VDAAAPADLTRFLADTRRSIDDALDRRIPALGTTPAELHHSMRYGLLAPGKRLRGAVVIAAARMLRGDEDAALALAGAVEMVHAASLILDDLPCMDDATLRRGRPVLHREFDEATAILTAVALLNGAFAAVHDIASLRERIRVRAAALLAEAIGPGGLIGGQIADLAATGERLDLDTLEYVHSHKTGTLFIAAAELGALCGGSRRREVEALRLWAKNLGLAFQITDDLLDYSGDPATTGKDAGLDRDKTTFVDLCGIDGSRRLVDELIDASISGLEPFGRRGGLLRALAEFVRARDR